LRVLLVEDDLMNVLLLVDVLEEAGHHVVVANDGERGRDLALAGGHDLCIFGVHLPGLPGSEAVRQLRSAGIRTPIVALSSSALTVEVDRGLAAGFDAYLTKPVAPSDLREVVRRYARPAA
jgi:DNA-binding response OmpR family regulator